MSEVIITPADVEKKLVQLSQALDLCQNDLETAEKKYANAKAELELGLAKSRITLGSQRNEAGKPLTATEKDDMALIENADAHLLLASAEAIVKATRANASRLKTQVDLARSIGSSVRSSMEIA